MFSQFDCCTDLDSDSSVQIEGRLQEVRRFLHGESPVLASVEAALRDSRDTRTGRFVSSRQRA